MSFKKKAMIFTKGSEEQYENPNIIITRKTTQCPNRTTDANQKNLTDI